MPLVLGLFGALAAAQSPAPPAVEIHVDAGVTLGPYRPIYAYFGYDEPNFTYAPNGRKLIGELAALSPVPVQIRAHHLLVTGDGTRGSEVGIHQCLYGRRRRPAGLRLDNRGPHLRHLPGSARQPLRGDRFHARGPLHPSRTVHPPLAHRRWQGLVLSAQGLQQMGRTGAPVGTPLGAALRQDRGGKLVVGGMERARYLLLARHARGIPQALRLHGRSCEAGAAGGQNRRPRLDRSERPRKPANSCASFWSTAPTEPTPPPARPARRSISSAITPRGRPGWSMATSR